MRIKTKFSKNISLWGTDYGIPYVERLSECVCTIALLPLEEEGKSILKYAIFNSIPVKVRPAEGHLNSVGGFCCPHHGDTCGAHHYTR